MPLTKGSLTSRNRLPGALIADDAESRKRSAALQMRARFTLTRFVGQ